MSGQLALAVDGGNSKTDLALILADGSVLSAVRGPGSSQQKLGIDGSTEVLRGLLEQAAADAGVTTGNGPIAEVGRVLIAGADLPEEEAALQKALMDQGWPQRTEVANDTFAVLRAGTDRGWGVALVCGAGINCVGVTEDGRVVRFAALGRITGDWGGGEDVGIDALWAAARGADGRGPQTRLEHAVPAHFGLETPLDVARAIHFGRLPAVRLNELAPVVLAEATRDPVAAEIVDRLKAEMTNLIRVTIARLGLNRQPFEVVLGGGMFRADGEDLVQAVTQAVGELAPDASVKALDAHPIVGAALLALDELNAEAAAKERVRQSLAAAIDRIGPTVAGLR
jgi:N-acetylglucosamine kinase-like BadF-type ATPase